MKKTSDFVDAPNHNILIIDDNPVNLSVTVEYLADHGFQIMVAQSGETGLELAQQYHPDLILLDMLLPGINGLETCCRLQADERTRDIPVIFMTIMTRVEDKIICRRSLSLVSNGRAGGPGAGPGTYPTDFGGDRSSAHRASHQA